MLAACRKTEVHMKIEGTCRQVCETTEFVAIVTADEDGPHVVGHWGNYMFLDLEEGMIAFPVGRYQKTGENLKKNPRVQLLAASKKVQGTKSMGQGCLMSGTAEIVAAGPAVEAVRVKFPWARGAIVVRVEDVKLQL
jgi:predicted pyridoxine 5'-phosphate oxidase superfamily flavin-nucleotide-binding protein